MDKTYYIDYRTGKISNTDEDFIPFIPGEVDKLHSIPGHERYLADRKGHIYSVHKTFIKKLVPDITSGYQRVCLDGEDIYVHKVIAEAFHPEHSSKENEVLHIDGDLFNNHANNLVWVTHQEAQIFGRWNPMFRKAVLPEKLEYYRNTNYTL